MRLRGVIKFWQPHLAPKRVGNFAEPTGGPAALVKRRLNLCEQIQVTLTSTPARTAVTLFPEHRGRKSMTYYPISAPLYGHDDAIEMRPAPARAEAFVLIRVDERLWWCERAKYQGLVAAGKLPPGAAIQ